MGSESVCQDKRISKVGSPLLLVIGFVTYLLTGCVLMFSSVLNSFSPCLKILASLGLRDWRRPSSG